MSLLKPKKKKKQKTGNVRVEEKTQKQSEGVRENKRKELIL